MLLASRTRACLAAALVLTTGIAPAAAQQRSFTIEQALAAPFPDELVAAPAGGAIAWVCNAQGVRNIWIATRPHHQGRGPAAHNGGGGTGVREPPPAPRAR